MYKITQKFQLNTDTFSMWIEAPLVANHAKAGQFIMLRVSETGERIPLTICDKNIKTGEVRIVFQAVGKTTIELAQKEKGEYLADFVGPLGAPTHLPVGVDAHIDPSKSTKVLVIAGGLGTAIALPQVKELYSRKIDTHAILGFRNKDLIILEDEFKASTHEVIVATDDGSNGQKGFVTDVLQNLLQRGARDGAPYALSEINSAPYDSIICIGPIPMMKAVCELTKKHDIPTIVSMNSTMIDGTGMCGCCRVTVGGEVKFACVDGPDFDGHSVDFDEAMRRNNYFASEEKRAIEVHKCKLGDAK